MNLDLNLLEKRINNLSKNLNKNYFELLSIYRDLVLYRNYIVKKHLII
jgi:hypothetical protein